MKREVLGLPRNLKPPCQAIQHPLIKTSLSTVYITFYRIPYLIPCIIGWQHSTPHSHVTRGTRYSKTTRPKRRWCRCHLSGMSTLHNTTIEIEIRGIQVYCIRIKRIGEVGRLSNIIWLHRSIDIALKTIFGFCSHWFYEIRILSQLFLPLQQPLTSLHTALYLSL